MQKPIIVGANPFIHTGITPINVTTRYNDPDYDETVPPLYQGFLSDGNLKITFTVLWNNHFELEDQTENPEFKAYREFQVTKFNTLYLHGVDRDKQPDHLEKSGRLSANPEIVQILFDKVLSPYGLSLNKVVMHDYKDFECIDFEFTNQEIYNKLCDLIDYTFRKNLT